LRLGFAYGVGPVRRERVHCGRGSDGEGRGRTRARGTCAPASRCLAQDPAGAATGPASRAAPARRALRSGLSSWAGSSASSRISSVQWPGFTMLSYTGVARWGGVCEGGWVVGPALGRVWRGARGRAAAAGGRAVLLHCVGAHRSTGTGRTRKPRSCAGSIEARSPWLQGRTRVRAACASASRQQRAQRGAAVSKRRPQQGMRPQRA
jgi:hypothetical protein